MMKGTARTYCHTSWATGQLFLAFALALFTSTTAAKANPTNNLLVTLESLEAMRIKEPTDVLTAMQLLDLETRRRLCNPE